MKKSLMALAVAGAFVAPAAMAEVTLSGAIALGLYWSDSSDSTGVSGDGTSQQGLASNYSHIDIESVDDIGNGNKVVFHYQMQVNPQNTGDNDGNPFNRNSYMSIQGGWGGLYWGTNENVYERFMYTADPLDGAQGVGGNLQLLGTPGLATVFETGTTGVGFYRRTSNTIWYVSPNFNGFSFEVDYSLSGGAKTTGVGSVDPTVLSIGGMYKPEGLPFYVDVAYETHDDYTGPGSSDTGFQVGVGYTFGDLALHARYEQLEYDTFGGVPGLTIERDAYWFAAKYNLPTGYIGAEFGVADEWDVSGGTAPDTGATLFGIGYFHNLSRQSQLYVIGTQVSNDQFGSYILAGASTPNTGLGADHKAITVGVKHTF